MSEALTGELVSKLQQEDLRLLLGPMASQGEEPLGSMGTDTPLAVLSDRPQLLFKYFKQLFAQVTNPPIDPIREELVMSLVSIIGPRPNLFDLHGLSTTKRLEVRQPILTNEDVAKIRSVEAALDGAFRTETIDTTWDAASGPAGLEMAIKEMCWAATEAVLQDHNILVISDRSISSTQVANVRVESRGRGAQGEAQTVGWLSRFFLSFQPF